MPTKKTVEKKPKVVKPLKAKPAIEAVPVVPIAEDAVIEAENLEEGDKAGKVEKYYEAVGRRKEATARVRVYTRKSSDAQPAEDRAIISVNDKPYAEYFNSASLQELVDAPLRKLKSLTRFKATVRVKGGGMTGQADAIKFGLSRALILFDPNFSKKLRKAGYLTRDAREKERRKYGLKKARKGPAWSKR